MSKLFKLKCTRTVGGFHTVGATYEFRFEEDPYPEDGGEVDGYVIDDTEQQHWINFPNSVNDRIDLEFKSSDHFEVVGVENDYAL